MSYIKIELDEFNGYWIDTDGVVWSTIKGKCRKLKPFPSSFGYFRVNLKTKTGHTTKFVHNLMCRTFIGEKNGLQIRHLDGNKANNALYNLKLGTAKENAKDRLEHGTIWGRRRPVTLYDSNQNPIMSFDCMAEAARHFKVRLCYIHSNLIKGRTTKFGKFKDTNNYSTNK